MEDADDVQTHRPLKQAGLVRLEDVTQLLPRSPQRILNDPHTDSERWTAQDAVTIRGLAPIQQANQIHAGGGHDLVPPTLRHPKAAIFVSDHVAIFRPLWSRRGRALASRPVAAAWESAAGDS